VPSDGYAQGVLKAYQGEVAGEALYRAAAEAASEPDRSYKFRALEQLELETKEKLRVVLERLGGSTEETAELREVGERIAASLFAGPDWRADMRRYASVIEPYVREFEQLEAEAPANDADVMAYLVAHERAQVTFAEREADGDATTSIEPVLALLTNPSVRR
jgi:hypothetical protein